MTSHDSATSPAAHPGLSLLARTIPVPTTVSGAAQAALAIQMPSMAEPPPASDVEAWRARISFGNDMMTAMYAPAAEAVGATSSLVEIAGVPVYDITPPGARPARKVFLEIHGGALIMGSGECCRAMGTMTAARVGARTYAVDYRMPPDHPYPAALDDCVAVYRGLLDTYGPGDIIIGGGSAGGNLAAATVLRARDEGLPMPAGVVLLTPELDLTESGDSFATNVGLDIVLQRSQAHATALYAGDHDLGHPYLSPMFGDFTQGFPPTLLQAGTRDLFLSNAVCMHRALRRAGIAAELHVFEAMPHGGFRFGGTVTPEDRDLDAEVRRFVDRIWG